MNQIGNLISLAKRLDSIRSIAVLTCATILLMGRPVFLPAATPIAEAYPKSTTDTIYVAPPTGKREIDRAGILAAVENVKPGGIIQFAPGTYVMGGLIFSITVPEISLLGHPDGTILKGCDPDEFPMKDSTEFGNNCNGLELAAGGQTVRNLTFEKFFWALHIGCCWDSGPGYKSGKGGQLIEGNTFRGNSNAVRVHGYWSEPTVIQKNKFLNNWHSATVYGNTAHILNNTISAPEPKEVQLLGFPGDGILVGPPMDLHETEEGVMRTCENNVVAGNFIDGVTEGIMMSADDPEIICRNNIIRNNTIIIRRADPPGIPEFIHIYDETDSTVVGVPLALRGPIEDNLIEENIIQGAEGLAIEIRGASNNRIVNNTITNVSQRKPFPGNAIAAIPVIGGDPETWREANGSAIWLSPGSDENEITGNTFKDIASAAVFIEGDRNRVEVQKTDDLVRDMGTGNQISTKNDSINPLYESKFVETRGIRLQYMDFGGEGLPVIFLQDFHDYFYEGSESPSFYASFTDNHRVLAPYARGWGESDNTGWGYDVATQSEDILGFMDALGIRRAVLAGRTGGDHDITWIAEHHPERVAGLIYYDNLRIFPDLHDPIVRSFVEMTWYTCHMGEESVARLGPRSAWRPHFLYDKSATINIPAIRFFAPEFHQNSRSLAVLGRIEQRGSEAASRCAPQATLDEYDSLSKNKERVATLRKALLEADLTSRANRAMDRAFGDYMTTIEEEEFSFEFRIPHIARFLEKVEKIESGKNE